MKVDDYTLGVIWSLGSYQEGGEPHNEVYWDDADYKLKNPILM